MMFSPPPFPTPMIRRKTVFIKMNCTLFDLVIAPHLILSDLWVLYLLLGKKHGKSSQLAAEEKESKMVQLEKILELLIL